MFIPDLQIPFEARDALQFCWSVKTEFKIPDENIYNVGDELDQYYGSRFPKDIDAAMTANREIELTRQKLQAWYRTFPQMKLCTSNHGMRWLYRAAEAGIPQQILKNYAEIIGAPSGWVWRDSWLIKAKQPIKVIHGVGYSGMNGHRTAAIDNGMNTVIGHIHSHAGIAHVATESQRIWGMNVGCLIDQKAFAFKYAKHSRFKACLTIGVVLDNGMTPMLIPYESHKL